MPRRRPCVPWILLVLSVLWALNLTPARAQLRQSGIVSGQVVDSMQGEPVPGVVVSVRGTTLGTRSDAQGRFTLTDVPPGDHILIFSKSGFDRATVADVRVLLGQTTRANGRISPEFYEMDTYEVVAELFEDPSELLLFEQRESLSMTDAIGSDMFKNLGVGDAAQALSKVTGASVADGKYAVIRGLADRYTFTTLNGNTLPSADPDRKAFQLDLLPAKFIEKIDVAKTFTPDMSGNFAGGSVDVVTKSYPEDFLFEFRIGTAYNTQSSLRDDFPGSDRSSTDWLAMDDGLRAMPSEAAAASPSGSTPLTPAQESSFKSSQLRPVGFDSPVDLGTELLVGFTKPVFGMPLGVLGGFQYKNRYQYEEGSIASYVPEFPDTNIQQRDTEFIRGIIDYQWGALANLSLTLNEYHELRFNFIYIQAAEDEATQARGTDGTTSFPGQGTYTEQNILHWTERNLTYFQLGGGHEAPGLNGLRLDWGGTLATTTQDEPDYRIMQFLAQPDVPSYNPDLVGASPTKPTRYWRELTEDNNNLRADLTLPLPSYTSGENALKGGVAFSRSERNYEQRGWIMVQDRTTDPRRQNHPFYTRNDANTWIAPENLQWIQYQNTPINLNYLGKEDIDAAYVMGDWSALDWLQLVGGVRYETTDLSISGQEVSANRPLDSGQIDQNDLLPAVSAKIQLRSNIDLRAAWSQTIVRPTYREIANVAIYDVTRGRTYFGNPELVVSDSENYDLRLAWYPRPGEILSASAFYKKIKNPIEVGSLDIENKQIQYQNYEQADVLGVEGEIRLGLDRLWNPLKPFTVGFNAAYIESEVPLTEDQKDLREIFNITDTVRPMYDQPSYILNADLTWDLEKTRTTITLSGGVVGEYLVLVGLVQPDEFVQPAPELNLFVRQRLGEHWDVRFTAKNLLDPAHEITQTWPGDEEPKVLESFTRGITLAVSVGCEF